MAGNRTPRIVIIITFSLCSQSQQAMPHIFFHLLQVMSVDRVESPARSEFDRALIIMSQPPPAQGHYQLFREHKEAWAQVWSQGRVEVQCTIQYNYYLLTIKHRANNHTIMYSA